MVEWRPVKGFEACYEVSSEGQIRSKERTCAASRGGVRRLRAVILKPKVCRTGYLSVTLRNAAEKQSKDALVHLLVAEAFLPPQPDGTEMRHQDGVRGNCRADNLKWGTHLENMHDQYRHGTRVASTWHPRAVLTAEQVALIRSSPKTGKQLALELGLAHTTVCRARRGQSYAVLSRNDLPALLPA